MNVRAAGAITRNELRRLQRHKEVVLFGLVLPVIIISLVGVTFGGTGSVDLGILDRDGSARSAALIARFEGRDGIDLQIYDDEDELRQDVRTTAIQAGLLIPEGYEEAVLDGAASLGVVAEPTSEGVASALATIQGAASAEGVREAAIAVVADGALDRSSAERVVDEQAETLTPVAVEADAVLGGEVGTGTFSHTAPANLTLFVFILTFAVSTIVAYDRKSGVISRLLSTPTGATTVIVGLGASKLAFALLQSALLIGVGSLAFGVEWGDPVGAVAIVLVFAVVSTAVGLLVGATVADQEQAQAIGIPLSIGMGMLGGCMWPLGIVPEPMQVIGHVTPHAWAMDSWMELIFDGGTLVDILPNLAVLGGFGLVVGLLAVRQLRRAVTG